MPRLGENNNNNEVQEQRQSQVINIVAQQDQVNAPAQNIVMPDQQINAPQAFDTAGYFTRMLENARDENLALQVRAAEQTNALQNVKGLKTDEKRRSFDQKLPAVNRDKRIRKAEETSVKRAKNIFRNADLCTVREMKSMDAYLKKLKKNRARGNAADPDIEGEDKVENTSLQNYVNLILRTEIGAEQLTDAYLSEHIAELYEYQRKLSRLNELKQQYPKFFKSLPDEQRVTLEVRENTAAALGELLNKHLYMHGLEVTGADGNAPGLKLRKESTNKTERHAQRANLLADYNKALKSFVTKNVFHDEVRLAQQYTKIGAFGLEEIMAPVMERINSDGEAREVVGDELLSASEEMKNALRVRNGLLAEQRGYLESYSATADPKQQAKLMLKIRRTNKKLRIATGHADGYREVIDFLLGDRKEISAGTARFLQKEKKEDLFSLVRLKGIGDSLYEAENELAKQKLTDQAEEIRKKAKKKSSVKAGQDEFEVILNENEQFEVEMSNKAAKQLEDAVKGMTYVKMGRTEFYSLVKKYKPAREIGGRLVKNKNAAVEKINSIREEIKNDPELLKLWKMDEDNPEIKRLKKNNPKDPKIEELLKAGKDKKAVLRTNDNDRITPLLMDPFGRFTELKDMKYVVMASYLQPTGDMPVDHPLRKEVVEKGLKPLVDKILSIKPEDMEKLRCPKNPDPDSEEFWHNRMLVSIGTDMKTFLEVLHNWDYTLKDEEFCKLNAFGRLMENYGPEYTNWDLFHQDPESVITDDPRFTEEHTYDVQQWFATVGDYDIPDAYEKRYTAEKLGYQASYMVQRNGWHRETRDVWNAAEGFISQKNFAYHSTLEEGTDPKQLYEEKLQQAIQGAEQERNKALREEMDKQKVYHPEFTEEEAKTRLLIKDKAKHVLNCFSESQNKRWNEHFQNNDAGGDIRSFAALMRPVERDLNGALTEKGLENKRLNDQEFEDYISGDKERVEKVLYRFAKDALSVNITDEMLSFEYIKTHYRELREQLDKVFGLLNIYQENPEYFEGDAFTDEEKDKLRSMMTGHGEGVWAVINLVNGVMTNYFGYKDQGEELVPPDAQKMNAGQKAAWGRSQQEMWEAQAGGLSEMLLPGKAIDQKEEELLKEKGDQLRKASALWAKYQTERYKVKREYDRKEAKLRARKEPASQQKLKDLKMVREALLGDLDRAVKLSKEVRDYMFGRIPENKYSQEARKFAEERL